MQMDPRQMAMMMKKMGITQRDIDGVQSVVITTATKEYRFARASVTVMTAQGTETWQIQGKPSVRELAPGSAAASPPSSSPSTSSSSSPTSTAPAGKTPEPEVTYTPTPEDIQTVSDAAGVPADKAKAALVAANGDLAQAIVDLEG